MESVAIIAIVGRPNVGKSTLFNRLIGKKHAIVSPTAGTTRDRIAQTFDCGGYPCTVVDTGGLENEKKENIEKDVQTQAKLAIEEADLILFVIDNNQELLADDFDAANILRRSKKNVILIGNKADFNTHQSQTHNFYELGFGAPTQISAIHKYGIEDLKEKIVKYLKKEKFKKPTKSIKLTEESEKKRPCNICILGQPNAGKSSLVNSFFGSEKIIVSDIPGTTRDVIDTEITYEDKKYNLIDTAGLRKPGKVKEKLEKFSTFRCLGAIERSDIAVILIDCTKGIGHQDCHIAQLILEAGKGLVLIINKTDIIEESEDTKNDFIAKLRYKFAFVPWAPILFISGKNKKNIYKIFEIADQIMAERNKRITTSALNNFLQKTTQKHLPASTKMRKPKFMYASQVDTSPPQFVMFFKHASNLHFSYPRYLENALRKEFGFNGTTIDIKLKESLKKRIL